MTTSEDEILLGLASFVKTTREKLKMAERCHEALVTEYESRMRQAEIEIIRLQRDIIELKKSRSDEQ